MSAFSALHEGKGLWNGESNPMQSNEIVGHGFYGIVSKSDQEQTDDASILSFLVVWISGCRLLRHILLCASKQGVTFRRIYEGRWPKSTPSTYY
ncbi:MAG: hypothetical protein WA874_21490 [Chryseosolibacter sp.]